MPFTVPVAPPAPNAGWVSSLSMLLMVSGIVLVLCALPPIRKAAGNLADELDSLFRPRPKRTPAPASQHSAAEPSASAETNAAAQPSTGRREIDDFDLSVFET